MGFVICDICVGFLMYGHLCVCGFCNVCLCVCMSFVIYDICVGFVMYGRLYAWVL